VPTAILLVKLLPDALRIPSRSTLQRANLELAREVAERKRAEGEVRRINEELQARVTERTAQLEAANRSLLQIIVVTDVLGAVLKESDSNEQSGDSND
jgi:hypothetical protein